MNKLTDLIAAEQLAALSAGVGAVGKIREMIHRLEYLEAAQLAGLNELACRIARDEGQPDGGELVHRAVQADIAAASRIGQVAAASRIGHAGALLSGYPVTAAALREGMVSLRHTEVIVEAGQIIGTAEGRAAFEAEAVPIATGTSAHRLRAHARRLAEHHADRSLDERHTEAKRRRCVRVTDLPDGMACLTAVIGAVEAYAIKDRVARIAHQARTLGPGSAKSSFASGGTAHTDAAHAGTAGSGTTEAGTAETDAADRRTLPQTQADVLVELLLAGIPAATGADSASGHTGPGSHTAAGGTRGLNSTGGAGGTAPEPSSGDPFATIRGRVQVSVPVFALTGATGPEAAPFAGPAELAGYGPIDTDTARRLTAHAPAFERVLTHPVSGMVLAVDRYRPGEDLRRLLAARDQQCRFIGCTRRIDHCDIDHTVPAARGGPTSIGNLGHLCRKHHTLKHHEFLNGCAWKPTQLPGGVYEWVSPTGARYRDTPTSTVRFAPIARAAPAAPGREPPPY